MSGAAMIMANQLLPLGMATKTRVNDHHSLIIPLKEMLPVVRQLFQPGDPWRKLGNKAYFNFLFKNDNDTLIRQRQMLVETGDKDLIFTEICSHSSFRLTSAWQLDGGSWADSGGSWADSGSDHLLKSEYSGHDKFIVDTPKQRLLVWGYYKDLTPCNEEGLKLSDGRVLIGIYDRVLGSAIKADDLNKLLPLAIQQGDNFLAYLNKNGIFKDEDDKNFDIFCRPEMLGPNLKLEQQMRSSTSTNMIFLNKKISFVHENHIYWQPAKNVEPWFGGDKTKGHIKCGKVEYRENGMIEMTYLAEKYSLYIVFVPGGVAGILLLQAADSTLEHPKFLEESFFIKDNHFWNHNLTTEHGIKLQIALNPNSTLVEVSFLTIPESLNLQLASELSGYTNVPIWMLKYYADYEKAN
jgi:hypothetical protein